MGADRAPVQVLEKFVVKARRCTLRLSERHWRHHKGVSNNDGQTGKQRPFPAWNFHDYSPERKSLLERAGSISQRAKLKGLEFWMEPILICAESGGWCRPMKRTQSGWFDDFRSNVRWEAVAKPTG